MGGHGIALLRLRLRGAAAYAMGGGCLHAAMGDNSCPRGEGPYGSGLLRHWSPVVDVRLEEASFSTALMWSPRELL